MLNPTDDNELLAQLNQLTLHVSGDCSGQEKSKAISMSDSAQAQISAYFKAAESSKKVIDPKIIAQRQKLPIYQKKAELLEVSKLMISFTYFLW